MPYKTPWLKDKNAGIVKIRNAVGDITTQTGNPVSVDNEFGLGEVDSLSVALNPVQNLNGYDSPWIGGAGKNMLPSIASQTLNGVTLTQNADGSITLNGTATNNTYFDFFPNGDFDSTKYAGYLFTLGSAYTTGTTSTVIIRISKANRASLQDISANRQAIRDEGNSLYIAIRVATGHTLNNVTYYPMLYASTKTDTYEPYENICPIIAANGINIYPPSVIPVGATGYHMASYTADVTEGQTYTISVSRASADKQINYSYKSSGGTYGSDARIIAASETSGKVTLTVPSGVVGINVYSSSESTVELKVQIERGSASTPYQPYQGIMVERTGKNLYPKTEIEGTAVGVTVTYDSTDGSYTINGVSTAYRGFVSTSSFYLKAGTYFLSATATQKGTRPELRSTDGLTTYRADTGSFTLDNDTEVKLRIIIGKSGITFNNFKVAYQIELGTEATEYEEYIAPTYYPYTLGQSVYGGTVDLVTGVLTIDRVSVMVDGSTGSGSSGVQNSSAENPNGKLYIYRVNQTWFDGFRQTTLSDRHIRSTTSTGTTIGIGEYFSSSGSNGATTNTYFVCPDPTVTDITGVRAWLAEHPFQFVYGLTDPITVQLTPAQIELLKGMNYISSSDDITLTVTLPGWTSLIDPSKIKHDIYDLDAGNTTGRNLAGEMLRDRVAVKEKLNLEFPPLVADDYYAMLNLIKDQFFDVLYYSPFTGGKRVATMYVGDREGEPYYDYDANDLGNNMWTNVKFNFIER